MATMVQGTKWTFGSFLGQRVSPAGAACMQASYENGVGFKPFCFVLGFINESLPTYNNTLFRGERQTSKLI